MWNLFLLSSLSFSTEQQEKEKLTAENEEGSRMKD